MICKCYNLSGKLPEKLRVFTADLSGIFATGMLVSENNVKEPVSLH